MRSISVGVTADHIASGTTCDTALCPVALAIMDAVTVDTHVIVESDSIITFYLGIETYWDAPGSVTGFISKFDRGQEVKPFEFTMTEQDFGEVF